MGKIFIIIRWVIRIIGLVYGLIAPYEHSNSLVLVCLIVELVLSLLSLMRFSLDSVVKVVTGFDGSGDVGYYDRTDNSTVRGFGYLCWLSAICLRVLILAIVFGFYQPLEPEIVDTMMRVIGGIL